MSDFNTQVPETIVFCLGAAVLFTLCVPDAGGLHGSLADHWAFSAAGYGHQIPSNSRISPDARQPNLTFLNQVGWQDGVEELEQEEDDQLPPCSAELVRSEDLADGNAASFILDAEDERGPLPLYIDEDLPDSSPGQNEVPSAPCLEKGDSSVLSLWPGC